MRFTVVTVCFNAEKELERTIQSVLNQDYPNIEYIIIDGGSTDNSIDIIRRFTNKISYWISEPDKGIYDAMNKGIAAATGDYINFMNAGDIFASHTVLSDVAKNLGENRPEVIYGDVIIQERGMDFLMQPKELTKIMPDRLPFCHQSAFVAVHYHKTHFFDTSFKCVADYNLFYHAYYQHNARFLYIPVVISIYDESCGFSKANMKKTHRERYRIWGIENDWLKVFNQEVKLVIRQIKDFTKNILPASWLKHYRK